MWPLSIWPFSTVPPVATIKFPGSALLQCSTAMCESIALLFLWSHSLSLFQFPMDYQQQYTTSRVGKVSPLPSFTNFFSPKNVTCGYFMHDFKSWMVVFSLKFSPWLVCCSLSQNLSRNGYIIPNDSSLYLMLFYVAYKNAAFHGCGMQPWCGGCDHRGFLDSDSLHAHE